MPRRTQILATGEIYHIYNRSVGKEEILSRLGQLHRALNIADFYRYPQQLRYSRFRLLPKAIKQAYEENFRQKDPLVDIYAFAFMPNHFHFLLGQNTDGGVKDFVKKLQTSFSKFFNLKTDRTGNLFQSSFKGKRIVTDEDFLHISRYVHLNPVTSFLIDYKDLNKYPWTSFPFYAHPAQKQTIVNTSKILGHFKSRDQYLQFVADQVDYQRTLGAIKYLITD